MDNFIHPVDLYKPTHLYHTSENLQLCIFFILDRLLLVTYIYQVPGMYAAIHTLCKKHWMNCQSGARILAYNPLEYRLLTFFFFFSF